MAIGSFRSLKLKCQHGTAVGCGHWPRELKGHQHLDAADEQPPIDQLMEVV
jgi:hypothetical protein